MIRVAKNSAAPLSLSTTSAYDGEDVKIALRNDHFEKCYICERHLVTDFQIEHLKSQKNHPALTLDWNNLFHSCGYCNGKKLNNYDHIIDPATNNVEQQIKQEIDFSVKKAVFISNNSSIQIPPTIELLSKVFNGNNRIRKCKEESFFEYCMSVVNHFQNLVSTYLSTSDAVVKNAIEEELGIEKEFLGFKYWIIQSNPALKVDFAAHIIWNK